MSPTLTLKQMLQALFVLILMIVIAWLAFYVLIVILALAAVAGASMFVYRFLLDKGILKPRPSADSSAGPSVDITVIETEYHEVDGSDQPKN